MITSPGAISCHWSYSSANSGRSTSISPISNTFDARSNVNARWNSSRWSVRCCWTNFSLIPTSFSQASVPIVTTRIPHRPYSLRVRNAAMTKPLRKPRPFSPASKAALTSVPRAARTRSGWRASIAASWRIARRRVPRTIPPVTARRLLWGMLAIGLVVGLYIAFTTYGVEYDIDSYVAVNGALGDDPLHLYTIVNAGPLNRWPYPSGFLPFVGLAHLAAKVVGPFDGWIQVPQILADIAIAWLVQSYLGRRGAGDRTRLAAAGLVALGPSFAIISGYHGQLDSFAILPALVAVYVWDVLPPGARRGVICGALVGAGIALKTAPGLVLFALLPTARDNRERAILAATAAAVPLITLAPWLIADPGGTTEALRSHRAVPGIGGLSLLLQPELSRIWLGTGVEQVSSLTQWFVDRQTAIVALCTIPFAVLLWRRRTPPAQAATILWLAFYVFATAFAFQYAVWGLSFALMAGYVRAVAIVQAVLLVPTLLVYVKPFDSGSEWFYVPVMAGLWIGLIVALARLTLQQPRRAPLRSPGYTTAR